MKFNMFEGARRIAMLIGATWAIGFVGFATFNEPYVSMDYKVVYLGAPPIPIDGCQKDDAKKYFSTQTPSGKKISIDLCFSASKASDGEMLVPYAPADNGKVWLGRNYSTEVSDYAQRIANSFQMNATDGKLAEEIYRTKRQEQWWESAKYLFGGLVVGWILITAIGWIVRGFLGIPQRRDNRKLD